GLFRSRHDGRSDSRASSEDATGARRQEAGMPRLAKRSHHVHIAAPNPRVTLGTSDQASWGTGAEGARRAEGGIDHAWTRGPVVLHAPVADPGLLDRGTGGRGLPGIE